MLLSLRQTAGIYVQRETELRNGVTIAGALGFGKKFLSTRRQPAASFAMEGLSKKPMPVVTRRIS
jgi:hypothetical protein